MQPKLEFIRKKKAAIFSIYYDKNRQRALLVAFRIVSPKCAVKTFDKILISAYLANIIHFPVCKNLRMSLI